MHSDRARIRAREEPLERRVRARRASTGAPTGRGPARAARTSPSSRTASTARPVAERRDREPHDAREHLAPRSIFAASCAESLVEEREPALRRDGLGAREPLRDEQAGAVERLRALARERGRERALRPRGTRAAASKPDESTPRGAPGRQRQRGERLARERRRARDSAPRPRRASVLDEHRRAGAERVAHRAMAGEPRRRTRERVRGRPWTRSTSSAPPAPGTRTKPRAPPSAARPAPSATSATSSGVRAPDSAAVTACRRASRAAVASASRRAVRSASHEGSVPHRGGWPRSTSSRRVHPVPPDDGLRGGVTRGWVDSRDERTQRQWTRCLAAWHIGRVSG